MSLPLRCRSQGSATRRAAHIAAARRHPEFAAADLGEGGDAVADLVLRRAREAQPHAAFAMSLVDGPFRPRIDRDVCCERTLIELQRGHAVRQLHPQEYAALRLLELGRGAE